MFFSPKPRAWMTNRLCIEEIFFFFFLFFSCNNFCFLFYWLFLWRSMWIETKGHLLHRNIISFIKEHTVKLYCENENTQTIQQETNVPNQAHPCLLSRIKYTRLTLVSHSIVEFPSASSRTVQNWEYFFMPIRSETKRCWLVVCTQACATCT